LQRADHSSEESCQLCKKDYETEEEARAQQRTEEPLINELTPASGYSCFTLFSCADNAV
jgi:hypothetical protein